MAYFIDGGEEKPFVKGSSKPKVEETLETKLYSMINSELIYKDGSKVLDVVDVSDIIICRVKKSDYIVHTKEKFNYEFEGMVSLSFKQNEILCTYPKNIKGYFQSDDDKEIQRMFNEIQVTT